MRGNPTYTQYDMSERGEEKKYPNWKDAAPNLQTFLTALNKSQPIIQCQYELVWSRWPRTIFFAKNITIPGISINTIDISHAGFTIKIPTHAKYDTTEVTINIIADKEGFHYYDLRNMVLQTGHPLLAGDPRATVGNPYGLSPDEDTLEVRLRNSPEDETHHHWILHNFHPTEIGDLELTQDSASFVEFELKGTITHVTYDCGNSKGEMPQQEQQQESQSGDSSSNPVVQLTQSPTLGVYVYNTETHEGKWEQKGQPVDVSGVELPPGTSQYGDNPNLNPDQTSTQKWNPQDWNGDASTQYIVKSENLTATKQDVQVDGKTMTMVKIQGNLTPEQTEILKQGGTQALINQLEMENKEQTSINQYADELQKLSDQSKNGQSGQTQPSDDQSTTGLKIQATKSADGTYTIEKATMLNSSKVLTQDDMVVQTQILTSLRNDYDKFVADNPTGNTVMKEMKKHQIQLQEEKMKVMQQWIDERNAEQPQTRGGSLPIGQLSQDQLEQMEYLFEAVKYNHDLPDNFITIVNPLEEIDLYNQRLTKMSLPGRFGMYKSKKEDAEEKLDIDPEDPPFNPSPRQMDPSHKVRGIFV